MTDQTQPDLTSKRIWRQQMLTVPIKSCGRLEMSTSMPDEVTLGRVTSDRVRYVYFEDGSECIVLGKFCDHVAFRAADWRVQWDRAEEAEARVWELVDERNEWRGGHHYLCDVFQRAPDLGPSQKPCNCREQLDDRGRDEAADMSGIGPPAR